MSNTRRIQTNAVGQRKLYRKIVETKQGTHGETYVSRYDTEETGETEVYYYKADVDLTRLEAMAYRAALNKGSKCKLGPVTVTITSRNVTGSPA